MTPKPPSDDEKRNIIPKRSDLPTRYHPVGNNLMVIPLPDIERVGELVLPERARYVLNEGHIIEVGPSCREKWDVGDCVTWEVNSEYRFDIEGSKFVLISEGSVQMRIPVSELSPPSDERQAVMEFVDRQIEKKPEFQGPMPQ